MNVPALRRSALVASVMEASARKALLASLPAELAVALRSEIDFVLRQGWDRIELAMPLLDFAKASGGQGASLSLEELLALSHRVPALTFSRVLAASGLRDDTFVLAALEPAYANAVRHALAHAPTQAPQIASLVMAWARAESVAQAELVHATR